MGQNSQEYRLKYWATYSSVCSPVSSFARSALLALLARSAALTHSLACLFCSLAHFARSLTLLACSLYSLAHIAHSTLAHSLTSLTPSLMKKWIIRWLFILFFSILAHSVMIGNLGSDHEDKGASPVRFTPTWRRPPVWGRLSILTWRRGAFPPSHPSRRCARRRFSWQSNLVIPFKDASSSSSSAALIRRFPLDARWFFLHFFFWRRQSILDLRKLWNRWI